MPTLTKYTTFFLLQMAWICDEALEDMVGSKSLTFFFSTFRAQTRIGKQEVNIIPAVKEFTSFTDSGVTVNDAGMAEGIGGEKSLGVTFFDPYGFFWKKFTTFPPFSYEVQSGPMSANLGQVGLRCNVYLCKVSGDPSVLTDENTDIFFLFKGQLSGQPQYNFDEKTLSITLGSRTYNASRGYTPSLADIDPISPAYNFLAAFLNEQMWPDVYGMAQHYPAVPLLKNPYFSVSVNRLIDYTLPTQRLYLEAAEGANDIFLDETLPANLEFFNYDFIFLITGSGSDQYGGSYAYKFQGKMGRDYYTDARGRLSRFLYCDIAPTSITHYWYINIPVKRINDPSNYSNGPDGTVHVTDRVKISLIGNGSLVEGGNALETPWLQHMWVRLQMSDNSIGDTREVTVKVIKQEGTICTLDWVSDCTPELILWAGRAAGPPTVFNTGAKIIPYASAFGELSSQLFINAYWNYANTYIVDTKLLDHGTAIRILDVALPNGQNGYSSLPVNAFEKMEGTTYKDIRTGNLPEYVGSCGHNVNFDINVDPGNREYIQAPGSFLWVKDPYANRAHEFCRFIRLRGREGILRFLCEEEFQRMGGGDFTYQLYVTAETYTDKYNCYDLELRQLMIDCDLKKEVWGFDYTPVQGGGVPIKKERWDLGDFYPGQMSDVEAMGIIASACGLKYSPNHLVSINPPVFSHYECYPVNFILKEKKDALNLLNEISWQKGKVLRQKSIRTATWEAPDFSIETVDLMNNVSIRCPEIKAWNGYVERPGGGTGTIGIGEDTVDSMGMAGSRYNFINRSTVDPLEPKCFFNATNILDDGIQFQVSPESNLTTRLVTKVYLNRGDDMVDVERTSSTIRYFGLRQLSSPVDYYAYAGRDTVSFLNFWLKRIGKPRLRVLFSAVLNDMSLTANIFDIAEIKPGTTLFFPDPEASPSFGVPPMYRKDLTEPWEMIFKGTDFPTYAMQHLTEYPIYGRIINKKINPYNASVEFMVEIENIKGYRTVANPEGLQSPIGGSFDIDGGVFTFSPYMQRGLPGPYDLIEGDVKIADLIKDAERAFWHTPTVTS